MIDGRMKRSRFQRLQRVLCEGTGSSRHEVGRTKVDYRGMDSHSGPVTALRRHRYFPQTVFRHLHSDVIIVSLDGPTFSKL